MLCPDGALDLPDDAVWFDVADRGCLQHATAAVRDDWARSMDVELSQPIPDWRQALEVAVPAHLRGQRVLEIADPMEAKQAVLDAIDRADPLVLGQLAPTGSCSGSSRRPGAGSPSIRWHRMLRCCSPVARTASTRSSTAASSRS